MAGFDDLVDDMDDMIMDSLSDGVASYQGAPSAPLVCGIPVIVDRNLVQNGPEGQFLSEAVGITWRKCLLPDALRGGVFTFGSKRYVVEVLIADDGHMVTAACMEAS